MFGVLHSWHSMDLGRVPGYNNRWYLRTYNDLVWDVAKRGRKVSEEKWNEIVYDGDTEMAPGRTTKYLTCGFLSSRVGCMFIVFSPKNIPQTLPCDNPEPMSLQHVVFSSPRAVRGMFMTEPGWPCRSTPLWTAKEVFPSDFGGLPVYRGRPSRWWDGLTNTKSKHY